MNWDEHNNWLRNRNKPCHSCVILNAAIVAIPQRIRDGNKSGLKNLSDHPSKSGKSRSSRQGKHIFFSSSSSSFFWTTIVFFSSSIVTWVFVFCFAFFLLVSCSSVFFIQSVYHDESEHFLENGFVWKLIICFQCNRTASDKETKNQSLWT